MVKGLNFVCIVHVRIQSELNLKTGIKKCDLIDLDFGFVGRYGLVIVFLRCCLVYVRKLIFTYKFTYKSCSGIQLEKVFSGMTFNRRLIIYFL